MAGGKKTTRKTTRRKVARGPLARIESELPKNLRDLRKQVASQLTQLERDIEKAERQTRRRAVKLLREASQQLGRLEAKGEAGWRQLNLPYRKELVNLLKRLERAVAPKRVARKKAAARRTSAQRGKGVPVKVSAEPKESAEQRSAAAS